MGTFVAPTFGGLLILARSTSGTAKAGEAVSLAERLQDAKAVQGPYIGIAVVLFLLAVAIFVARLPRISTHSEPGSKGGASVWGHPLLLLGVIAIFVYVGAEVTIGSFMISYISSPHVIGVTTAAAAKYVTFYWGGAMVGRFIGSAVMRKVNPALILGFNSVAAVVALAVSMISGGEVALWSIILVGLCNSIMFPTIFTLAIKGLGPLTGRGSGFLIMAICGGGLLPLAQGTLADMAGVGLTLSFVAPVICYVYLVYFAWKSYQLRSADDGDAVPALVGH
jgi:FHS family L-fucose permease-like MFS transporter